MTREETKAPIRQFILKEFLPGEDEASLTDSLELIEGGVLDSLARLKLVAFLEEHFKFQLAAHEATPANLETIDAMASLVERKLRK